MKLSTYSLLLFGALLAIAASNVPVVLADTSPDTSRPPVNIPPIPPMPPEYPQPCTDGGYRSYPDGPCIGGIEDPTQPPAPPVIIFPGGDNPQPSKQEPPTSQQTASPSVELKLTAGTAVIRVDGTKQSQTVINSETLSFTDKAEIKAYGYLSVDFGDNGFVRLDGGRATITVYRDGRIDVNDDGGSIFADACKNLTREGEGRWIISH